MAVHELALIERDLRDSDCEDVHVRLSSDGARLGFATWEFNEHYRGTVTARVCRAVCATARWELAVIHDTIEDPQDGSMHSLLTVRRADR